MEGKANCDKIMTKLKNAFFTRILKSFHILTLFVS